MKIKLRVPQAKRKFAASPLHSESHHGSRIISCCHNSALLDASSSLTSGDKTPKLLQICISTCSRFLNGLENASHNMGSLSIEGRFDEHLMQDIFDYAKKNGVTLTDQGPCQFCGSPVTRGVFECHEKVHHIATLLDFAHPSSYTSRFLSVDAMALQHCEVHGPWNNHIHLIRLFLMFERRVKWDYSKTPQLSAIINHYKKDKEEILSPPPLQQRGSLTTMDLVSSATAEECIDVVERWAKEVFMSFKSHHLLVSSIADTFLEKYS